MCEYCVSDSDSFVVNKSEYLDGQKYELFGLMVSIDGENSKMDTTVTVGNCEVFDVKTKISYCPMCGRKLSE